MSEESVNFGELLRETWSGLRGFRPDDLAVVTKLEELVARAPAELGPLSAEHGFGETELMWLNLPLESGRAVVSLLNKVEQFEGVPRLEEQLLVLRSAGLRIQSAAASAAALTAERMSQQGGAR